MIDAGQRVAEGEILQGAPGGTEIWRIWPGDGVPPGSESWDWTERTAQVPESATPRIYTRNVVIPTVTVHRPARGTSNGTALIVAPGGGFHFLMMEHEGHQMASWLTALGVTVLVLKYRLMRTPDADEEMIAFRAELQKRLGQQTPFDPFDTTPPERAFMRDVRLLGEEDGRQAIRFARTHAGDFGISPGKIGIAGFSAGGGVAMGAAMQHDAASRPDYAVAIYPAWRGDLQVPAKAPPLFLAISDDDLTIPPISSTRLYEAWHRSGASAELHVFGNGGHGWGMDGPDYLSHIWPTLLENWLKFQKVL
ncbi:MAG: alpha/beta hydrolase fold domain-containing protein [Devosia sp.]